MKPWHYLILGIFIGLLASALILIIASPPRGKPVLLRPIPSPKPITVHISGAIVKPGVYYLPQESRLVDLIQLAGGLTADADENLLNLAKIVKDSEKITISTRLDTQVKNPSLSENHPEEKKININLASKEDLTSLPGIGDSKAQAIIDYRIKKGAFLSINELENVPGIGGGIFEKLKDLISID
jgi:competence protein ComEA